MQEKEYKFELYNMQANPCVIIASFGTTARVCKSAVDSLKEEGIEVGLFRPITLFPYPSKPLNEIAEMNSTKLFLTVEMNNGQMIEDVRLATKERKPIHFYGRQGGMVPAPEEVVEQIKNLLKGVKA
jgi:2-oxoglutarate ferredoxin oxidoreductase subunit alpha